MSETKKYIDLNYLQSFWTFIKGIPTSVKYTLNNKSQTIKDAIDDLGTNKQDKLEPGFGIEIQDDTILAEVKYIRQDEEWKDQIWNEYSSIESLRIWTDYNGIIHYDASSTHYYLDSDSVTWKPHTWSGTNYIYGEYIWRDNNGIIHFDANSNHYYLDSDNKTWKQQTWSGYTSINGEYIWKDNNGVMHYDYGTNHYYLDSDNKTWKQQTWSGYTGIFNGTNIWRDNNGIIHFDDENSNHYYLDSDNKTWKQQTWSGYTGRIFGFGIWRDYNGIIHYDYGLEHYYLQESKEQYLTRHNDELQTKITAGEGVSIKNGVISATVKNQDLSGYATESWVESKGYLTEHQSLTEYAKKSELPTIPTNVSTFTNDAGYLTEHQDISTKQDVLTPGFGIEIQDDNTIDSEVEYEDVENHFEETTLVVPNNGYGNHIFYTKNGTIYYMFNNTFYYLNRLSNTWVELDATTCPGNGQETWMDYDGTIRYEKYKLNENTNTWSLDSNEQVSIGYGHTVYTDYNGILRSSSAGVARTRNISTLQWEIDADQTGPYNSYGTWFDYNGIIHCGEYLLNKSTGLWESDSSGIRKLDGGAIEDNNGILHYFYGQAHQILDKETNTWVDEPLVGVLATDRFYGNQFWTDYQGNLHFGKYLFITKNRGYITRHNDRLQLKLIPGNGVNINKNNVISVIPSDAQSPLTPGFGIEIDGNDTILAEVEYREGDGECNDAARAILGGDWRIPTKEDWNELISNTTATWNDGIQLTSRINGQTIFLPAGGTYIDYNVDGDVLAGTYWTSSASSNATPNNLIAHDVLFDMGGNISVRSFNKYNGELIRPITKTPGNNVVDLGLPSRTLWSTRNLTATGLTSSINSYGDYFAWGEIVPKSEYSSETYSLKNSYNTTDGIFVLRTGGEAGYFTRHNDELQTKLKAGDNITISNGIISAIGGDLSNYYNKTEVDNKISAIPKFSISVVSTLPTTNISSTTVYLVANTTTQTQNLYTEYIYVNSKWEKLGEQTIDLSGYATTTALNAKQDSLTTAQLSAVNSGITSTKVSTYDGYANSIANKVDKASGKGLSTNDYTTTEKNKLAGIAENANNYSHPTYTSKTSGLYKITVDGTGHISGTAAVTASDLPSHSHTTTLTTDSGTPSVTLAHNTTYKLTTGDSSVIFKTPSDNNTINTAGAAASTDTKLYLVGSSKQDTYNQTNTNVNCYIGTDNCLYSGGNKVLTSHQSLASYLKVDGSNGTAAGVSTLLNKLSSGTSVPVDDDYYISQYANGGTTTTTYHRRPVSKLWEYIKGKADTTYAPYANRVKRCTITKDSTTTAKWTRFGYINVPKHIGYRNYECTLLITGNWGNDNVFTANGIYKFGFRTGSTGGVEGTWCGWQSKYTYADSILNDDWVRVYQGTDWQHSDGNTYFTVDLWICLGPAYSSFNITVLSEGHRDLTHTGSINLESKNASYGSPSGTQWTANITPQYSLSNHTHSYLPLSGGTMTGTITLKQNQYLDSGGGINCNNADIIGCNGIYTGDLADNTSEGIRFYRDSTHWDSLTASGGVLYFKPNDLQAGVAFTDTSVKKVEFQGHTHSNYINNTEDFKVLNLTSVSKDILTAVKEFGTTTPPVREGYIYTTTDGGSSGITDKPVDGKGFGCKVYLSRYVSATDYRYDLICWADTNAAPYYAVVKQNTTAITWSHCATTSNLSSYVAKAGDTMTSNAALIFPISSDNRKTKISGGDMSFLATTSGGWATGNTWRTNDETTKIWATGVYGTAGTIRYAFTGTSYDTPTVKYRDGQVGIAGTLNIGITKDNSETISGGCKMTYNSTNKSLEFIF